ncbi:unnamed protein product [Paramecium sonneborni]|uniref:Cyclic nucleotide-binding domain-containing protein n=1 Tax=Paramecium sonneborni TaxID=65129 RepID=A0A8S1QGV0_9CILI|nr:unnamed protein product [Paramecium sonneborni]
MYETFGEKEEKELHLMRKRFGKLRFETDHNIEKSKLMSTYIEQTKQDARSVLLNQTPQSKMNLNLQMSRLQTNTSLMDSNSTKRNLFQKKTNSNNRNFSARTTNRITSLPNNYFFNFPKWMEERQDFQKWKQHEDFDIHLKIVSICKSESFRRDDGQKTIVALYLQTLSLFKLMPLEMLKELGGRLTYIELKTEADLTLCRYGEKGECMFIIFKGKVDVISFDGKLLKVFGSNEHVGRSALETDAPRNATLITNFESHILKLQRWDFQQCLNNLFKIERPKWKKFVETIHFFDSFHPHKIERMCDELKGRFMSTKDCLYKAGDQVDNFYIVKNGTLVKNVVVDLEESNRWPIGAKEWEKKTITTCQRIPLQYKAQSLLGYYEIVTFEQLQLKKRTETIDAAEDSFVLFIPKTLFTEIFDADDQKKFRDLYTRLHPTSFEILISKVKSEETKKKQEFQIINKAITDGLLSVPQHLLEKKFQKYSKVFDNAKNKLYQFKQSREIIKREKRTKNMISIYE